jgi:hypothetical protein
VTPLKLAGTGNYNKKAVSAFRKGHTTDQSGYNTKTWQMRRAIHWVRRLPEDIFDAYLNPEP